jgi:hypothetical protein
MKGTSSDALYFNGCRKLFEQLGAEISNLNYFFKNVRFCSKFHGCSKIPHLTVRAYFFFSISRIAFQKCKNRGLRKKGPPPVYFPPFFQIRPQGTDKVDGALALIFPLLPHF